MDEQRNPRIGRDVCPDQYLATRRAEVGAGAGARVGATVGGPPGA